MGQSIHFYDDNAGVIYLDDGREIPVDPRNYSSVQQAAEQLTEWAKRQGLIGQQDVVAAFS